ncbi:hypothetical protein KKG71_02615 [Patescibacteria group bacterium]|nr:hypothetical protein [Patescibacteria group bacterium]
MGSGIIIIGIIVIIIFLPLIAAASLLKSKWQIIIINNIDYIISLVFVLFLLLYISPLNHAKWIQSLFLLSLFYTVGWIIAGFIIYYLINKRFKRAIILFLIVGVAYVGAFYANNMRKIILQETINTFYCPADNLKYYDKILGGIIYAGSTGFLNETHCMMPMCQEEFYYCNR